MVVPGSCFPNKCWFWASIGICIKGNLYHVGLNSTNGSQRFAHEGHAGKKKKKKNKARKDALVSVTPQPKQVVNFPIKHRTQIVIQEIYIT